MRKLNFGVVLVFLMLSLSFVSCSEDVEIPKASVVDVTFDMEQLTGNKADVSKIANKWDYGNKKDGSVQTYPDCSEETPTHVLVTIDGTQYTIQFTSLENETEVLQLKAGAENIITEFLVYAGGEIIYEMPEVTSIEVIDGGLTGVPYDMDLAAFTKKKVHVDVVCWHDYSHSTLTWQWYELNYSQIKTLCFYGDVCTKFFDDFHEEGSDYFGQEYDGYDFPAIFSIKIFDGDTMIAFESNVDWQGVGAPLCVEYMDNLGIDEDFRFELWFTSPDGTTLVYGDTFEDGIFSEDGNALGFGGEDGLFVFSVGNCDSQGNNDLELALPAYLPLPAQAEFMVSGSTYANGYLSTEVRGIVGVYALENMVYPGWCGAKSDVIYRNVWYTADVKSSLVPGAITRYNQNQINSLNWLVNNMDGYTNQQIQAAIWYITDNYGSGNSLSTNAASNINFNVKVGDWAIVVFDAIEDDMKNDVQLFIVKVDP